MAVDDHDLPHLAGSGSSAIAALKYRTLDLSADDPGLDDDLGVVLTRDLDGRLQGLGLGHLGDAHARTGAGRLDEDGPAQ